MYKPLADSTLQRMKKTEIIELLRIAEHNAKVAEEYVDQQAENLKDWAPVRHGRWIWHNKWEPFEFKYECSICHDGSDLESKYCPNCGATMDG